MKRYVRATIPELEAGLVGLMGVGLGWLAGALTGAVTPGRWIMAAGAAGVIIWELVARNRATEAHHITKEAE